MSAEVVGNRVDMDDKVSSRLVDMLGANLTSYISGDDAFTEKLKRRIALEYLDAVTALDGDVAAKASLIGSPPRLQNGEELVSVADYIGSFDIKTVQDAEVLRGTLHMLVDDIKYEPFTS